MRLFIQPGDIFANKVTPKSLTVSGNNRIVKTFSYTIPLTSTFIGDFENIPDISVDLSFEMLLFEFSEAIVRFRLGNSNPIVFFVTFQSRHGIIIDEGLPEPVLPYSTNYVIIGANYVMFTITQNITRNSDNVPFDVKYVYTFLLYIDLNEVKITPIILDTNQSNRSNSTRIILPPLDVISAGGNIPI